MNGFEIRLATGACRGLHCTDLLTLQVNLGLLCNQRCRHCHLACSPDRTEIMDWPVMEAILAAAAAVRPSRVDLTGGAPELNPHFRRFVAALADGGLRVQVRTNLTALLEPGQELTAEFLRGHDVDLVASMPCYLAENVDACRGAGAYARSVESIRRLNALGYGVDGGRKLNLVFNPAGPSLPPEPAALEGDYRSQLGERFGVQFTRLLTITNMPIGRFANELERTGRAGGYMQLLRDSYNAGTVPGLMCRRQISVGWDGTLYDCDFNLALGLSVDHGAPDHIRNFDASALIERQIVTGEHCFGCTAGLGSSCSGSLA